MFIRGRKERESEEEKVSGEVEWGSRDGGVLGCWGVSKDGFTTKWCKTKSLNCLYFSSSMYLSKTYSSKVHK